MGNSQFSDIVVKFTSDISGFTQGANAVSQKVSEMSKSISAGTSADMGVTTQMNNAVKAVTSGAKSIKTPLTSINTQVKKVTASFTSLGRIGRFLVFSYIGRQLINLTKSMLVAGANMAEIENLFVVSFGDMAGEAQAFAKSLEVAWGVSQTQTKEQTAYLNTMVKSMGMTEEASYGISTAMVQLSHNMASLYNLDQVDVLYKIRSGLVGISKPLLNIGINTKVANLQVTALAHGITSSNRELTQQERILATVWALWDQTESSWKSGTMVINGQTVAVGDMTKTIGTNANMLRVVKSRLSDLMRYWGLAFQPVVSFVLPVLYTLINALIVAGQALGTFMAQLFHVSDFTGDGIVDFSDIVGIVGQSSSSTDDFNDSLDDTTDSAEEAQDAIDNLTGGIDELNVLDSSSNDASSTVPDSSGIENDIGLPDFDKLQEGVISDIISQRMTELKETLGDLVGTTTDFMHILEGLLAVIALFSVLGTIIPYFATFGTETFTLIPGISELSGILMGFVTSISAVGLIIGALVTIFVVGFVHLMKTSKEFRDNVTQHLQDILEKFKEIGEKIDTNFIQPIIKAVKDMIAYIWKTGGTEFVKNMTDLIFSLMDTILNIVDFLVTYVLPVVTTFVKAIIIIIGEIITVVMNMVSVASLLISGFLDFMNSGFIKVIADAFNELKSNFKDTVNDVSNSFTSFTNSFKTGWENFWGGIGDFFSGMWSGIKTTFKDSLNWIIDKLNVGISRINSSLDIYVPPLKVAGVTVFEGFSYDVPDIPNIPRLYNGGLAYGDTLARVGDYANSSSNPEVISPLNKLQSLTNNNATSQEQIELLKQQNALLQQILSKDTSINVDGKILAKTVNKANSKIGYNLGIQF